MVNPHHLQPREKVRTSPGGMPAGTYEAPSFDLGEAEPMNDTISPQGDAPEPTPTRTRNPTDYSDRARASLDSLGPGRPLRSRRPPARRRPLRPVILFVISGLVVPAIAWSSKGPPPAPDPEVFAPSGTTRSPSSLSSATRLIPKSPPGASRPKVAARAVPKAATAGATKTASVVAPVPVGRSAAPDAKLSARRDVAELQRLLARLDLRPGPPDGIIGNRTIHAIRQYQRYADLDVNGRATVKLLEDLRAVVALMPVAAR